NCSTKPSSGRKGRPSPTCIARPSRNRRCGRSRNESTPSAFALSGRPTSRRIMGTKLHKPSANTKQSQEGTMLKECRSHGYFREHHVIGLIETDPKGRYQFEDGKIRATYGHSMDLDLDLPTEGIPDVLFYPTTEEESHLLMEAGLRPSDRKMVHLSATFAAALEAGRVRIAQPVILEIDAKTARASGVVIHKAGKTVY